MFLLNILLLTSNLLIFGDVGYSRCIDLVSQIICALLFLMLENIIKIKKIDAEGIISTQYILKLKKQNILNNWFSSCEEAQKLLALFAHRTKKGNTTCRDYERKANTNSVFCLISSQYPLVSHVF